ncbi:hypothetical protein GF325_10450 [Candidatus Bathyarchaeota archaeon]|nr:hypothetical protein [Candidatus Bathyarchaeota archaeon]
MTNWIEIIQDFINDFIDYFLAQSLATQILIGVLILLGMIAIGFAIAGAVWIAIQVIKITILGVILLAYLVGLGITFLFMLPNHRIEIKTMWQNSCDRMEHLMNTFYPKQVEKTLSSQGMHVQVAGTRCHPSNSYNHCRTQISCQQGRMEIPYKPGMNSKLQKASSRYTMPNPVMNHGNYEKVDETAKDHDDDPLKECETGTDSKMNMGDGMKGSLGTQGNSKTREFFCTNCGTRFTQQMKRILEDNGSCYCEVCGNRFNLVKGIPASP